jgi:ElaB/YqjD/DUF883 family membrane-anchored ribosome-binding protein
MSELQNSLSEKTAGIEELASDLEKKYSRFTDAASRAVHNGKTIAQRWCKQGLSAAKDFSGNAADRVKHDPVSAAAVSFAVGLGLGILIGRSAAHEAGAPAPA